MGVKLQSRTQLVAKGFDSPPPFPPPTPPYRHLPPPPSPRLALAVRPSPRHAEGGHVIDACTHVHKVHLCERRGKSRDDVNDPTTLRRFSQSPSFSLSSPFSFSPPRLLRRVLCEYHVAQVERFYLPSILFFLPFFFLNNHRRP